MANVGTNGASLVQTNLTTNGALFAASGGVLSSSSTMKITSNVLTNTAQPCFCAYKSSNSTNFTGGGVNSYPICDTVRTNQGSGYNGSTGVFTAPVTGQYFFQWQLALAALSVTFTEMVTYLLTSSKSIKAADFNIGVVTSPFGEYFGTYSVFCPMTAGDTATIQLTVYGGTQVVTLSGSSDMWTFFTGFLVC